MKQFFISDRLARYILACLNVADEERSHIEQYNVTLDELSNLIDCLTNV